MLLTRGISPCRESNGVVDRVVAVLGLKEKFLVSMFLSNLVPL